MRIDLHVHTKALSSCSIIDPEELIGEARKLGLDGICITEHNAVWSPEDIASLNAKSDVRFFRGNEVTTNQGHIVVFGYYDEAPRSRPSTNFERRLMLRGGS